MKIKSELETLIGILEELKNELGDTYDKSAFKVDFAENLWNIKQEIKKIVNNYLHADDYYANSTVTTIKKQDGIKLDSLEDFKNLIKSKTKTDDIPYNVGLSGDVTWVTEDGLRSPEIGTYRPQWTNDESSEQEEQPRSMEERIMDARRRFVGRSTGEIMRDHPLPPVDFPTLTQQDAETLTNRFRELAGNVTLHTRPSPIDYTGVVVNLGEANLRGDVFPGEPEIVNPLSQTLAATAERLSTIGGAYTIPNTEENTSETEPQIESEESSL